MHGINLKSLLQVARFAWSDGQLAEEARMAIRNAHHRTVASAAASGARRPQVQRERPGRRKREREACPACGARSAPS
jgi:hypothetical protein